MTTIAYRDGVMAADTRAYSGSRAPIGYKTKIERLKNGTLIGVSSSTAGGGETVRKWWEAGAPTDFDLPPSFSMLAVEQSGVVYYASDTHHVSGPLAGPFFAIGSGNEIAIGAMQMNAAAVEAVRAGTMHDPWSAMPIDALSLDGKTWRVAE